VATSIASTSACAVEVSVAISPKARIDVIDVRRRLVDEHGGVLNAFPWTLYCSDHTTAGYLDQSLMSRLNASREGIGPYLRAFQSVFPEGAGYQHDELHLREELSEEERRTEPRNGDSHLAFISAGLRTCVTYRNRPGEPVYFVDLDGMNGDFRRHRITRVLGFNEERVVARDRVTIPVTAEPVYSMNLKDPCLGLFDRVQALIDRSGIVRGRIHMALVEAERQAGLTVNEYEALLMQRDLPEVIRNPFRFMVANHPCRLVTRLRRIRTTTMICTRFLRLQRSISLLVSDFETPGCSRPVQGRYQSPILVQWGCAGATRDIDLCLTEFQ
jgi:hypothetical protein